MVTIDPWKTKNGGQLKQRAQGYVAPMIRIVSDRDRPINTPHDE